MTEGYMDTIALDRAGIHNAVGLMGTNLSNSQIGLLQTQKNLTHIVLALDADKAGIQSTIANATKLMDYGYKISIVDYSNHKVKDIDELLSKTNATEVKKLIKASSNNDYIDFLISHKFTSKMPLDEIQAEFKRIVPMIAKYGNEDKFDNYFDKIVELTKLDKNDVALAFYQSSAKLDIKNIYHSKP
jgi:DNA primase